MRKMKQIKNIIKPNDRFTIEKLDKNKYEVYRIEKTASPEITAYDLAGMKIGTLRQVLRWYKIVLRHQTSLKVKLKAQQDGSNIKACK